MYYSCDRSTGQQKKNFVRMPTHATMVDTASRMNAKYHLPNFAFALDGMMGLWLGSTKNLGAYWQLMHLRPIGAVSNFML